MQGITTKDFYVIYALIEKELTQAEYNTEHPLLIDGLPSRKEIEQNIKKLKASRWYNDLLEAREHLQLNVPFAIISN